MSCGKRRSAVAAGIALLLVLGALGALGPAAPLAAEPPEEGAGEEGASAGSEGGADIPSPQPSPAAAGEGDAAGAEGEGDVAEEVVEGLALGAQPALGDFWSARTWVPIWVQATNSGPDFTGRLVVVPERPTGPTPRFERRIELPRGARKSFWVYVQLQDGEWALWVRLEPDEGPRTHQVKVRLGSWRAGPAVGLLGAPAPRPGRLAGALGEGSNVVALTPERLPDRWVGFGALEAVVVAQAAGGLLPGAEQAAALAQWVSCGGRLIVVASQGEAAVRGTPWEALLPARLGARVEVRGLGALGLLAGVAERPRGRLLISSLAAAAGGAEAQDWGGRSLVVRGRHGRGEVLLLTFDPWDPLVAEWPGLREFWRRVLTGQAAGEVRPPPDPRRNAWARRRSWQDVTQDLAHASLFGPVRLDRLRLLLAVYLAILWPLDAWLQRRLRRPRWMWGMMVFWAAAFGGVAAWMGVEGRERGPAIRQVTLLDAHPDGSATGQVCAVLYSPWGGTYSVSPAPESSLLWEAPARLAGRMAVFPGADDGGETLEQGARPRLTDVRLAGGRARSFGTTFVAPAGATPWLEATLAGGEIRVCNRGPSRLTGLLVAQGGDLYSCATDMAPGETRVPVWEHAGGRGVMDVAYLARMAKPGGRAWPALQLAWLNEMCKALVNSDEQAERHLRAGGRVFLATFERSPFRLRLEGVAADVQEWCIVRVFVP